MKFTHDPSGWQQTFAQEGLLHRITNRIRQSLELQEILESTVAEVRSFLGTARVKVYRFEADESGQVIAESIDNERLPSLLGLHFPADDIPPYAREIFLKARQRSIVDVTSGQIGISMLENPETSTSPTTDIYYRAVDPCHIEYLKAMGVQSSLVVPILSQDQNNIKQESRQGNGASSLQEARCDEQSCAQGFRVLSRPHLWGLLVSHHTEPRTILQQELRIVQHVVDQVSIAIAQSQLFSDARAEKEREATINQVTSLLHTLPSIQLQPALEATIAALKGAGGRLYIQETSELYTWGDQPIPPHNFENSLIEQHPVWKSWVDKQLKRKLSGQNDNVWAINDLYKEPEWRVLSLAFESTRIRGILVTPLLYRQDFIGFLTIFRTEIDTEILWAGQRDRNPNQLVTQISFATWREQKKGQAPRWEPEDFTLAQALSHQFSSAIKQQQMYRQLKVLNHSLESQVKQQTVELQKSLQLAHVVRHVTNQISSTLDLSTILQTIVREVRELLNTDRVLLYHLLNNFDGEVVVEQVQGNWSSVLGMKAPPECFPDEYNLLYFRGRIRVINNVSAASLSPCHQDFLQELQVQANMIVPINMGTQLWGLLIAHECKGPREWQDTEIELLQQLADQAAIAIQQAQLYEQSRTAEAQATAKALQLEQTLLELQKAQTQLVQTEKMSSLGQLVAGLAHEINNPINFISGNVSHAIQSTEGLLELLHLYQLHFPNANQEINSKAQEIDFEFLAYDLPKIMSSMQAGADRIRSLVLSLRSFSRLDQAEMKPVDLHEGIDNTLLLLQHRLTAKPDSPGIEVIKDYGDLPVIECFAGQMNQVFMNILTNAIDALTNEEGFVSSAKIWISTKIVPDKSRILIRFADNGSGMTETTKKRIFDPFFTTKPVGKGTGLGLAISYQIVVENHGGRINCISEPGNGTEFQIEIPVI
ncbi:GAF domain-containing protein [Aetokthonos hydrillicola Thurmond2011]|jgi:light-regulated signal transduction histidine kinase (bacteriophytochrome)|uniref:histidine kinase n=1 Tax=Aetokthonos hydrillicola Thurmond2011 TaxID=2712845 RepID=A0AAP5I8H0_9CYAN|nr:GAF domain-containing protein [Aetokthonos hydrillicola]MBO3460012.1 GAF domain-containing protein [Aetokthonos hydrillicola CCALA 1050]MBW4584609.1 GAF domain-containing protein [Aetokthonos hydrillicola CCALA 1050]MDR9895153.1 GAF domain-containing protein [Aetokthonos hydrillicola Thurmond2011]